jgi:predicted nuclease of predicted toxin-antitoxin system
MKFFFDECLDPELTKVALAAGFEATCSRDRGMLSRKDWNLAPYVVEHDYVLVTHNSKDFRGKTAGPGGKPGHLTKDMHPGLVCLNRDATGDMTPSLQEALFREALVEIANQGIVDLMNQVLEIDYDSVTDTVTATLYEAPS